MWILFWPTEKNNKGEGVQGGPGGVQREEQRESAASEQANRGKTSLIVKGKARSRSSL